MEDMLYPREQCSRTPLLVSKICERRTNVMDDDDYDKACRELDRYRWVDEGKYENTCAKLGWILEYGRPTNDIITLVDSL